jgi:hypothetical protein
MRTRIITKIYKYPTIILIVLIALAAVCAFPLSANAGEAGAVHYSVTFMSGNVVIRTYVVAYGDTIPDSVVPTSADIMAADHFNGDFIGWSLTGNSSGKYFTADPDKTGASYQNFYNYPIMGNVSFNAVYGGAYLHDGAWFSDAETSGATDSDVSGLSATANTGAAAATIGETSAASQGQNESAAASAQPAPQAAPETSNKTELPEPDSLQKAETVELPGGQKTPTEYLPTMGVTGGLSGLEQGSGLPAETIQALIRDGFSDTEIMQMGQQTGNMLVDLESNSVPFGNGSVRNAWSLLSMLMVAIAAIMILHIKIFVEKRQWKENEERYKTVRELQTVTITVGVLTLILWFMVDNLSRPMVWANRYTVYVACYFVAHLVLYSVYKTAYNKLRRRRRRTKARYQRPRATVETAVSR